MTQVVSPAPSEARPPARRHAGVIVLLAVVAALVFVGVRLVDAPTSVRHVEVQNPASVPVDVEVAGAGHDDWLAVAIVLPRATARSDDVVDQGATWYFRFSTAGCRGGELKISGDRLRAAGWTVRIPPTVTRRLERDCGSP